jgi:hypothetical protein
MNLKLIAIYLDESQLEYIIAVNSYLTQDFFNFNFEYYDAQSDFAELHQVKSFPTFFLTKDDRIVTSFQGKLEYKQLRTLLLESSYVQLTNT